MDPAMKQILTDVVRLSVQYAIVNAHRTSIVQNELAEIVANNEPGEIPAAIQKMLDDKIAEAERIIEAARALGK